MATHTRTHSHFFLCLQSWWWGGHSKQLRESGIERETVCQGTYECMERTMEGEKTSRKVKEGVCYLERRRRQNGYLATSSQCCVEWDSRRRNSSYSSAQCHFCSAKPCMSTALQIQRQPCLCVTDSCVKPVLPSVYVRASSDLHPYMLLLCWVEAHKLG